MSVCLDVDVESLLVVVKVYGAIVVTLVKEVGEEELHSQRDPLQEGTILVSTHVQTVLKFLIKSHHQYNPKEAAQQVIGNTT